MGGWAFGQKDLVTRTEQTGGGVLSRLVDRQQDEGAGQGSHVRVDGRVEVFLLVTVRVMLGKNNEAVAGKRSPQQTQRMQMVREREGDVVEGGGCAGVRGCR